MKQDRPTSAEAPPIEIGAHKLFPPPVRANAILRQSIVDHLRQSTERVVVLQAPAGSGKSTTLRQLLTASETDGARTTWLTLDDGDNDPRRFEAHFLALVQKLVPERPLSAGLEGSLDALALLSYPAAIFIDELQVIRTESILSSLRSFLPRLPPTTRMFLGSRTLPDVGLATLLVNGVALVLRAEDLRFTEEETLEFFASDARLRRAEVETIYQRTEGWPAGLQLFRLALASPAVRTSLEDLATHGPRELAEYLTDNVVSVQAPLVQEFLLRTSLLRRLSGPLCDVILQRAGSQQLLEHLERSGLFLTALDSQCGWFKYHGLFAGSLAENLRRTAPGMLAEVHVRAARWHIENGSYEEAVYHAVEAHDPLLAVDALSRCASRLVASGELVTVERWFDELPFAAIANRMDLCIQIAYALVFLRRRDKLPVLLAHLSAHEDRGDVQTTTSPRIALSMAAIFEDDVPGAAKIAATCDVHDLTQGGFPAFELGAACNLLAFVGTSAGQFEVAHKYLSLARAHNGRAGAAFSGGYTTAVAGIDHMMQAQLGEALQRFSTEAVAHYARQDKSLSLAAVAAAHIWALYEANELAEVEQMAKRFQQDIATSSVPEFTAVSHLAIARMHDACGRPMQAQDAIEALAKLGHDGGWPRLVQLADWERARRALMSGDRARAARVVERIGVPVSSEPGWLAASEAMGGSALGRIRLAIHAGDHASATRDLAAELAMMPARAYYQVKLLVLDAVLQHARGQLNNAHRSLRKALQLAQAGGLVRCFLDEGPRVIELLQEEHRAAADSPRRVYLEQLLSAAGATLEVTPAPVSIEPLSEREKEILAYLCSGISNKEMATRLFVSENTIKFHLKNIYGKLAVGSRSQAAHAARQLNLTQ